MAKPKWMPLLGTALAIRMDVLDAEAADKNHGQTLERLAERGGLSITEVAAVIQRRYWRQMRDHEAADVLLNEAAKRLREAAGGEHG